MKRESTMKPKLLICDKCGELHTGEVTCCPVCASCDCVLDHSVGDECCMCDDGHLVEAVVLPKTVADEQEAIVRAIERLGVAKLWRSPCGQWCATGLTEPHPLSNYRYTGTLRAALEAAVAATKWFGMITRRITPEDGK